MIEINDFLSFIAPKATLREEVRVFVFIFCVVFPPLFRVFVAFSTEEFFNRNGICP